MLRGVPFKFRFSGPGVKASWLAGKGFVDEKGITLSGALFTPVEIKSVSIREDKFVLGLQPNAVIPSSMKKVVSNGNYVVLEIYRVNKDYLKKTIDGLLSRNKDSLNEGSFCQCPDCSANVQNFENSLYTYCPFCECVFTGDDVVTPGTTYRMCDGCNLFGSVRYQKEFYFYAYLVSNQWTTNYKHLCTNCSTALFLDMLPKNLPFIAGLPATLAIPIKSWMNRMPELKGLSKANRLIQAKKTKKAEPLINSMLEVYNEHPGLLYNLAVGWLSNDEQSKAMDLLERSLRSCPSYEHSHQLFKRIENFIDGTI